MRRIWTKLDLLFFLFFPLLWQGECGYDSQFWTLCSWSQAPLFPPIVVAACEFDDDSSEEDRPSTSTSNPTRRTLPDLNLSPIPEESNYDLYNGIDNIEKEKQERYAIEVSNMKDNKNHIFNKIFYEI